MENHFKDAEKFQASDQAVLKQNRAVRANAQLMARNFKQNNSEGNAPVDKIESIVRNTTRMMSTINHLRTFSRQSISGFGLMIVD